MYLMLLVMLVFDTRISGNRNLEVIFFFYSLLQILQNVGVCFPKMFSYSQGNIIDSIYLVWFSIYLKKVNQQKPWRTS